MITKLSKAIKIKGTDLKELRNQAKGLKNAIADIEGVVDLQIEQQVLIPQVQLKVNREAAAS